MKIISKLLHRTPASADRNRKIRGLSTAELVGIIVIVGILGALGGTYVNGLVSQANTNAGMQNATTLNTVAASILAAGATLNTGAPAAGDATAGVLDADNATDCINEMNLGVTVKSNGNPVLYQMTPPISAAAIAGNSYKITAAGGTAGAPATVTFTYAGNGATP
jgi:Tfp pilus assembly major pilin PilA